MLLRMLSCALLLTIVVAVKLPATPQSGQDREEPSTEPRWEYKVVKLDQNRCSNEQMMAEALNKIGQKGWELMSYDRLSSSFPKEADGTLLLKPAATGAGKLNNPQTVDSFEGTMNIKMPQGPADCRLLFKRISPGPGKR
jgi:Domain of unknown function (DUF4177)